MYANWLFFWQTEESNIVFFRNAAHHTAELQRVIKIQNFQFPLLQSFSLEISFMIGGSKKQHHGDDADDWNVIFPCRALLLFSEYVIGVYHLVEQFHA